MKECCLRLTTSCLVLLAVLGAAGCSDSGSPLSPGSPDAAGPALDSPSDNQQLDTQRPTLTVVNSTATGGSGSRTYDFQVASDGTFGTVVFSKTGVPEGASKTSVTVDQDLSAGTLFYWRARLTRGSSSSDWSPTGRFRTRAVGRNIAGELFDPLTGGTTVGTRIGSTTFIPGKGIQLNDIFSYVRYDLPAPVPQGEFSMEVEGLHPNGPGGKPKIFQITDLPDAIPSSSASMINAQYRGTPGNPDNSIAFKAVLGSTTNANAIVEPDLAKRNASVINLDPTHTYFWQGIWTTTTFRLVVKDGGASGTTIYDYTMTAPAGTGLSSGQLYAFIGTNYEKFSALTGTFPGMIVRNVWLSNKPRPAGLSSDR
jgi:hypothetical protein